MTTEKKSESGWEESEQLGPYQLHEQVQQDPPGQGELYRATHETSGAAALVLKPAKDDSVPRSDWEMRCISSGDPNYLAVQVERSPWTFAPGKRSAEELVFAFEDLRDGVRRMAEHVPTTHEPRGRRRLALALAGAAAACALLFVLAHLFPASQPPDSPDPMANAEPAPVSQEVPTDTQVPLTELSLLGPVDGGLLALAHPLPSKPYKGQKRPPCRPRVEMEINGGCWVPHELKAPCPEDLYEHQGKCYTVSMQPQSPAQSLEP
ncbi:hypothetical protein [Vitiosangium sp. GDMCC 1.1324]|uniref:hypothetical protein n=1 Tax=Vitiosangium sp. (strain GDMCC 1.1324) TaxID=2138576 RepID=UPI000D38A9CD|nr:hypothetical protein [Vitiosangium sp. GDMCC 1.1324]PTL79874.1 hypothetical protein DAT35_31045 [Vitiosangium sp. GDMCC 1.1324]